MILNEMKMCSRVPFMQADLKEVMDRLHDLENQLEQSMQKKVS